MQQDAAKEGKEERAKGEGSAAASEKGGNSTCFCVLLIELERCLVVLGEIANGMVV